MTPGDVRQVGERIEGGPALEVGEEEAHLAWRAGGAQSQHPRHEEFALAAAGHPRDDGVGPVRDEVHDGVPGVVEPDDRAEPGERSTAGSSEPRCDRGRSGCLGSGQLFCQRRQSRAMCSACARETPSTAIWRASPPASSRASAGEVTVSTASHAGGTRADGSTRTIANSASGGIGAALR